jgi:hypothetical protein
MTVDQLVEAIRRALPFLELLAARTQTELDDHAVAFLKALVSRPRVLDDVLCRLKSEGTL